MSPRVGRLLVLGYQGSIPPPDLFTFAERFGLGGVILFARNCPDAATVSGAIRSLRSGLAAVDPGPPTFVMVDQEGGRVERIRDGVPALPAAGVLGDAEPAVLEGRVRAQAVALAGLGIDVNLAPVCDVVQAGESGAIGDRSFGGDPERVARLAAAHVQGTLAGGILPCAKHFPGHGSARLDSHRDLARLEKDLDALESCDLVPFRAAIRAGVPLVMVGHLLCPAVDPRPASLSPTWLHEVLRRRLGFDGAVISDDMEMGALDGLGFPPETAVEAVNAGCDLLIFGRMLRPEVDAAAVAEALERRVPRRRVEEALSRIRQVPETCA